MSTITMDSEFDTLPSQNRLRGWPALLPLLVICFIVLVFAGCASQSNKEPVAQLSRAQSAVTSAVNAGARESAPLELKRAEDLLESASKANAGEQFDSAKQFAEKAEVDAALAEAMAKHAVASNSLAEIESVIGDLKNQVNQPTR